LSGWLKSQATDIDRASIVDALLSLDGDAILALVHDWWVYARPDQCIPDGDWETWLILAGRGWGKTRTGAEAVRQMVSNGSARRIALVGRTAGDVRDVMVEGPSGILSVFPAEERPIYEPSKRRITFHTGAIATTYTGDKPDQLRGPEHDVAWCDELAAWRYATEAWDNLCFGLRLGKCPRTIVTTTPRPTRLIRELATDDRGAVHVTRGSTYDNRANLPEAFIHRLEQKYNGTRIGRQEIEAMLLEQAEGALWSLSQIDDLRVQTIPVLSQVVVAIDPAVTSGEGADETGIVVAGKTADGKGYVLEDLSGKYTPSEWARKAISAYERHNANRIIGEVNNGGDLIERNLRVENASIPYRGVRASRGKYLRAEPVSALYEQGRVHHVGVFPDLEDQMTQWAPGDPHSPDRLDALVWAFTDLLVEYRTFQVGHFRM
jgi:predicted phage terminase large subunit-like protein